MKILQELGLTEDEIQNINDENVNDYVGRIKNNFYSLAKADNEFVKELTEPIKSQVIGKENQYKKLIKNHFGLEITNDELAKTDANKLLELGKEKLQKELNTNDVIVKYQNNESEYLTKLQAYENQIEELKIESENKINEFIKKQKIDESMLLKLEAEPLINKANILTFKDVIYSLLQSDGYSLTIDERKDLHLTDSDGMFVKDGNKILTVNEYIKRTVLKLQGGLFNLPNNEKGFVQKAVAKDGKQILRYG